ncbi:hypothetical protein EDD16DRAFT_1137015 [Pisolithus croceorrhizus]|nr:hypothetical protein EDD16DRAFT_1137015 [Pisolithus croceorrhizus]KAI6143560.1 hypothetical protein EDD17DRAFT_204616 [Pisolithus thermaeus]
MKFICCLVVRTYMVQTSGACDIQYTSRLTVLRVPSSRTLRSNMDDGPCDSSRITTGRVCRRTSILWAGFGRPL